VRKLVTAATLLIGMVVAGGVPAHAQAPEGKGQDQADAAKPLASPTKLTKPLEPLIEQTFVVPFTHTAKSPQTKVCSVFVTVQYHDAAGNRVGGDGRHVQIPKSKGSSSATVPMEAPPANATKAHVCVTVICSDGKGKVTEVGVAACEDVIVSGDF